MIRILNAFFPFVLLGCIAGSSTKTFCGNTSEEEIVYQSSSGTVYRFRQTSEYWLRLLIDGENMFVDDPGLNIPLSLGKIYKLDGFFLISNTLIAGGKDKAGSLECRSVEKLIGGNDESVLIECTNLENQEALQILFDDEIGVRMIRRPSDKKREELWLMSSEGLGKPCLG